MSKTHTPHVDYSRYFAAKQRVYLINISEEKCIEQYKSMSGSIVSCNEDSVALQIPYATGLECLETSTTERTYKLTTESRGAGIQIMADLVRITENNVFHLKLRGNLEMYQRRQVPRIDTIINVFQIRRDTPLTVYRKEFKRIMDTMYTKGIRPNLKLQETPINLGAGGISIAVETLEPASHLSMFFLDLDAKQPLVCAVAEMVWCRHENDKLLCGYRFIQIHKTDQERISRYVQSFQKKRGIATSSTRTYWELLDRMSNMEQEE
jgi:c-di-GMP-binding flagellar brake protein YcgR